jgi:hypothetical protein
VTTIVMSLSTYSNLNIVVLIIPNDEHIILLIPVISLEIALIYVVYKQMFTFFSLY